MTLDAVVEILIEAGTQLAALNGRKASGFGRALAREEAVMARQLSSAADQLTLAAALVRNEYWALKGETSYAI